MAHVERSGRRWRARYRTPEGQARSRTFDRRADADRFLATVEADKARGSWVDPLDGRRTLGDYAAEWQRLQVHRPTTAAQVETHLRRHVLPYFGDRTIAAIRPSEVQAWVKHRSEVLAPATVEVVYRHLAAILLAAVKDRVIAHTPCVDIRLPKVIPRRLTPLEPDQVEALAGAVPERYRALVVLAAGTGLRQGEALGLTVPRVDFLRRSVRVEQQLVLLPKRPPYLAPPKTAASHRAVPLPDVVLEAVAAHLAAYPAVDAPGIGPLVFTDDRGRPIRRNRMAELWRRAARSVGLADGSGFHELRHFYASLLIRHGESVKVVQSRLGHATASETLDTYGHLWPDSDDRTRQAVDKVLGGWGSGRQTRSDTVADRPVRSL